ncbi:GFA family protein [Phaeobacter sp.]|uniref:GFA family protein n=1 Tax=Phaeobacter sp. TaxID=1902409 RepID=UPI0025FAE59F|nr:GFA family protein [Phaeobacter sp.]
MAHQYDAGCLCGAIHVQVEGSPLRVGLCHCKDCRRHHGALFYAAAIFPSSSVRVTGVTAHYEGRHFCPTCGSSVFATTEDEIEIHLGCMNSTEDLRPSYELWCQNRERWLPPFPGTTCHQRNRDEA